MTEIDTTDLPTLPPRDPAGHKGTFGTVCIVGGCARPDTPMIGAPALAARGALRSGCGLARLAMPVQILTEAIQQIPSATGIGLDTDENGNASLCESSLELIQESDSLVVGPGMGADRTRQHPIAQCVADCIAIGLPTVVDADGLNALVAGSLLAKLDLSRCVLTPHPGEFARLAKDRGITEDGTDKDERPEATAALAKSLGCVVVLKGAGTVVSDGSKSWVCGRGHPCLGTAGTGDVLAGVLASLIAQLRLHSYTMYDITRIAVQAHALAGESWATSRLADGGMLASELTDELPSVIQQLR
ncbi:MAG: hypothetical protein Phyf2KO_01640 [Phycisphaerales bacterium]